MCLFSIDSGDNIGNRDLFNPPPPLVAVRNTRRSVGRSFLLPLNSASQLLCPSITLLRGDRIN